MAINVGRDVKAVTTGQQTIAHGLGAVPKAMIFVMSRGHSSLGTYEENAILAIGFTDGTTHFSASMASAGNESTSDSSSGRRADPLHAVLWGDTTPVIGEFVSWDATNITLDWTANNAEAWNIGFVAIGGDGIDATVLTWATGIVTGNLSITGAGFEPTSAFHLHDGVESVTVPNVTQDGHISLGVVSGSDQWYVYGRNEDDVGAALTWAESGSDAFLWKCDHDGNEDGKVAHVSFDGDGQTVNRIVETTSSMTVGALFLRGISVDVFSLTKSISLGVPVAQNETLSINPEAVFLMSDQKASNDLRDDLRLAIGLADANTEIAFQVHDIDAEDPTVAVDYVSTSKGLVLANNDTPSTTSEADISFNGANLVLTWTTNNIVAALIRGAAFASITPATTYVQPDSRRRPRLTHRQRAALFSKVYSIPRDHAVAIDPIVIEFTVVDPVIRRAGGHVAGSDIVRPVGARTVRPVD